MQANRSRLTSLLVPPPLEIVVYVILGALTLLALNGKALWRYVQTNILGPGARLDGGHHYYLSGFKETLNRLSSNRAALVIFWLFVGTSVYIALWFMHNIFLNIRNDFVADHYVHPESYSHTSFWRTVISRKVFFGLSLVIFIAYCIEGIRLVKALSNNFYTTVISYNSLSDIAQILAYILALSFLFYGFVLLAKASLRSWRLIYGDL